MDRLGKAPWTVLVLLVLTLAGSVILTVLAPGPLLPRLFFLGLMAVVCLLLLSAARWLWIVLIALIPVGFAQEIIEGRSPTWYGLILTAVELFLLLHPLTREFFQRNPAQADA